MVQAIVLHISVERMSADANDDARGSNTEAATTAPGVATDKPTPTSNKAIDTSKMPETHTQLSKEPIHMLNILPLRSLLTEGNSSKGVMTIGMSKPKRPPVADMVRITGQWMLGTRIDELPVGGNDVEMTPVNGQTGAMGGGAPPSRDPNAILNECRDIDRGIDNIQRNLERLKHLQTKAINDPDASQGTATNRELDSLSADTMTLYRSFTARIKSIKSRKESGEPRNAPQVGLVERKLKKAINEYQQVDSEYRHQLSSQMERQYRIVRPEASEQEVKEAIQDTSNNQVFSQAVRLNFSSW